MSGKSEDSDTTTTATETTDFEEDLADRIFYEFVFVIDKRIEEEKVLNRREKLKTRLTEAGLQIRISESSTGTFEFIEVGIDLTKLEERAEAIELKVRVAAGTGRENDSDVVYQEFRLANKSHFKMSTVKGCVFNSCERQRVILNIIEEQRRKGGAGINMSKLQSKDVIKDFYGLHNKDELEPLMEVWNRKKTFPQPINDIRDYFGENIAFYFAYLGKYTYFLVFSAIFACVVGIMQLNNSSSQGADVDMPISIFYAFFVTLWITVFIEMWKRRQNNWAYVWDMLDFAKEEMIRPEYKGYERVSPITMRKEIYYPVWKRRMKYIATYGFVLFMIAAAVAIAVSLSLEKLGLTDESEEEESAGNGIWRGVLIGFSITALSVIFGKVVYKLTAWENHRTDSDHENSLILKFFMFQFFNNFSALFIIAFIARDFNYLSTQLASILITKQAIGNINEIFKPWIIGKIKRKLAERKRKSAKEDGQDVTKIKTIEKQFLMPRYSNTIDDYTEMMIQLGWISFFVVAFPLAAVLALLNNLIEVHTDASKLTTMKRPEPRGARGIGRWMEILELMSVLAIISNAALIFDMKSLDVFGDVPDTSAAGRVWIIVALEHGLFILKYIIHQIVSDFPKSVKIEMEREQFLKEQALKKVQGREDSYESSTTSEEQ